MGGDGRTNGGPVEDYHEAPGRKRGPSRGGGGQMTHDGRDGSDDWYIYGDYATCVHCGEMKLLDDISTHLCSLQIPSK